jgi:hypothetical protein
MIFIKVAKIALFGGAVTWTAGSIDGMVKNRYAARLLKTRP